MFCDWLISLAGEEDSFQVTEALAGFDPEWPRLSSRSKWSAVRLRLCAQARIVPGPAESSAINYLARTTARSAASCWTLNQLCHRGADRARRIRRCARRSGLLCRDYLSYQQDAVATEAYIETARSRVSLRRHALLVDYMFRRMQCRAWIHSKSRLRSISTVSDRFYTFAPGMPSDSRWFESRRSALLTGVIVFEPCRTPSSFRAQSDVLLHLGRHQLLSPQGATKLLCWHLTHCKLEMCLSSRK